MQLRHWIGETLEGAAWSIRFDELLVEISAEEAGGPTSPGVVGARAALQEHVTKARWRRGERL